MHYHSAGKVSKEMGMEYNYTHGHSVGDQILHTLTEQSIFFTLLYKMPLIVTVQEIGFHALTLQ